MPGYDLIVLGSGAAGLSAAITARLGGLSVLLLEKEPCFGGTTARSGGWAWIPGNGLPGAPLAEEDRRAARDYLRAEAGPHFNAEKVDTYLEHAPRMLKTLMQATELRLELSPGYPDYHPDKPGGVDSGRSLYSPPFDGRRLGEALSLLAQPFPESLFMGIGLNSGPELRHFLNATRSLRSAAYVLQRMAGHYWDKLRHGRGMRLVNGNALAGRLLKSALDLGVVCRASVRVQGLHLIDGRVAGVDVGDPREIIHARRGVVLATGGFSHDKRRVQRQFAHVNAGLTHFSLVPRGNSGDGLTLGESAGAAIDGRSSQPAAWAPVSRPVRPDGSTGKFFHLIDRAKPGVIVVNRQGQRFCNESDCYHDVVQSLVQQPGAMAWIVCDHATLRRYGLGAVRPAPLSYRQHLRSGYLRMGRTVGELARVIQVDAQGLEETVQHHNQDAARAVDERFQRGRTAYNRLLGDASHPNPCMGSLASGPFYAIQLFAGDLGTYVGFQTRPNGQVLRHDGEPIEGLYAVGNDVTTFAGGSYPGAGAMVGPALTSGFLCGEHLAATTSPRPIPA